MCEKEFCKNIKFGLVALASLYGSCFNTSLSCYTLQIFFVVKKLTPRKQQVQISFNYPMQKVMPSWSYLNQKLR